MSMLKQFIFSVLFIISVTSHAGSEQPLPLNQAFKPSATLLDPNTLQVTWNITAGYFLYKERFHFTLDDEPQQLGPIKFPKNAKTKSDTQLGTYSIYRNVANFILPFLANKAGDNVLRINYQGCADSGFCYPPSVSTWVISINDQLAAVNISPLGNEAVVSDSETLKIQHLLTNQSWFLIALTCLGLGLLLSFTPCVLPMYPILSGIIVGYGDSITTVKAFRLSLTYVLSMALSYTLIGILFALVGKNIQASLQQPWIIILLAMLFILLALSMFGFYDLKMPAFIENRLTSLSQRQRGGSYLGVAIMGCLATLILSPCVTAPLVGVLSYITQSGNIFLGGSALFFLGFGMGIPLLLIGSSSGTLLPQTGPWMEKIKILFGVLLLGVAVLLLSRIIPDNLFSRQTINSQQAEFTTVKSISDVAAAIKQNSGKPIMLDFYASWCLSCKVIEREVLNDPKISPTLRQFVYLKADITANDATDVALMSHYQVIAPPTFIFFDKQGHELKNYRLVGEVNAALFSQQLQKILLS